MSIASFEQYNPHHTLFVMLLSTPPPDVQDTKTTEPIVFSVHNYTLHFACSLCYHSHREGDFGGSFSAVRARWFGRNGERVATKFSLYILLMCVWTGCVVWLLHY
jgi:hypothetical protein